MAGLYVRKLDCVCLCMHIPLCVCACVFLYLLHTEQQNTHSSSKGSTFWLTLTTSKNCLKIKTGFEVGVGLAFFFF